MGWIKDLSPSVHAFRIEFRKDVLRNSRPAKDGTGPSTLGDREVTLHVDPMSPSWLLRNGLPMETQMFQLVTDDPADLADVTTGDRFIRVSDEAVLIAKTRPQDAGVTDFPCVQLMAEDQTQMGRR